MRIRSSLLIAAMSVVVAWLLVATATASGTVASQPPECTITETNSDDELHGTSGPDVICARGGTDVVWGEAGAMSSAGVAGTALCSGAMAMTASMEVPRATISRGARRRSAVRAGWR